MMGHPQRINSKSSSNIMIRLQSIQLIKLLATTSTAFCLLINFFSSVHFCHADDRKTAGELVRSRGFDLDEYDVISQNYPLKVYRIINPLADPKALHYIPVVTSHGISWDMTNMMSSSKNARPRKPIVHARVTLYAMENGTDDRGLHFYLSNNNYDVWMIEARATNYRVQRRVKDETPADKSFWDFSLDEQALIDLPTQIDFILSKTGAPKVAYIAYSQSTTLMFALLSMKPDYGDKLATFIALAPVVYTSHLRGLVWPTSVARIYLQPSAAHSNIPEWMRRTSNFVLTYLCSISFVKYTLCRYLWKQFSGPDKHAFLDGGMTEDVLKSTSFKSFEQYVTNALLKDFRMYDYKDEMRNMEEYGQPVPPQYNISKITLKTIVLFRGTNDYLSDPEDQMILLSRLRVPLYEDHILEDYSHIDFIVSPTVTRDVNEPILRVLDKLTDRPVRKVLHTLGEPNPQIIGTPLAIDVDSDWKLVKDSIRSHVTIGSTTSYFPEADLPRGGVYNQPNATSVREQLFGKDTTAEGKWR